MACSSGGTVSRLLRGWVKLSYASPPIRPPTSIHGPRACHDARLPFSGDDRRPPKRVLQEIEAKQRAARDSRFPETADLPDAFDDLYYAWIDMRKFVNGLAERVLSGQIPGAADLRAFDVRRVRRRVREFQKAHPDVADPYVALFKECEEILDLVTRASET